MPFLMDNGGDLTIFHSVSISCDEGSWTLSHPLPILWALVDASETLLLCRAV